MGNLYQLPRSGLWSRREMAGEAFPNVATVVLSWNGRDDTLACLESLAGLDWPRHHTIVVDNGSTDGTVAAIEAAHPDATVIATGRNLGFAEGNNVGLRAAMEAGADYVLLLNNDTLVARDLLRQLVAEAERRPDAGAFCPLIYYLDEPDRIWYAGARFDARRGHNGRHTGYGERDTGQYDRPREIGRATGAAMLVRRAVIDEVGLLDGDLFLQVEDVEWSLRMRQAGWRVFFVPAAKVWHKVSVATGGEHAPATAYYEMRNTLAVCDRYAPLRGVSAVRRRAAIWGVAVLHSRRGRRPTENLRAVVEGWRDYRDGRLGPRPRPQPQPAAVADPREEAAAPARAVRVA
jgi:GT2 family glycosyltransferase